MKKLTKLFIALALIVPIMAFSISTDAAEDENLDIGVQENACTAYEELMDSFPESRATGQKIYPDYYGGSYINDNGKLVIYITEGTDIPTPLNNDENVVYEICDYSYNELLDVMDALNAFKFEHGADSVAKNYNMFGLYDADNRVIVQLDNLSDETIEDFKKLVCDSEAIVFEQGTGPAQMEIDVNAGSSASATAGTASIGYRVTRNGTVGYVTAGHFVSAGDVVYCDGTAFSSCVVSQRSGNVDGAFCSITNSDYVLTNTLAGTSNTLSTTISEPGVGTVINKIGQSSGHTSGKVISTNVTVTFASGDTISNLTAASYESKAGDSGGVVYSYISSSNTRLTLGIHTGANETTRYYTKANEINSALGTTRY